MMDNLFEIGTIFILLVGVAVWTFYDVRDAAKCEPPSELDQWRAWFEEWQDDMTSQAARAAPYEPSSTKNDPTP